MTSRLPSREEIRWWVTCSPRNAWRRSLNRWKSSRTRKPCVRFGTTRMASHNFLLSQLSTRDTGQPRRAGCGLFWATGPRTAKKAPACAASARTRKGRHPIIGRKADRISASAIRLPPCGFCPQSSKWKTRNRLCLCRTSRAGLRGVHSRPRPSKDPKRLIKRGVLGSTGYWVLGSAHCTFMNTRSAGRSFACPATQ